MTKNDIEKVLGMVKNASPSYSLLVSLRVENALRSRITEINKDISLFSRIRVVPMSSFEDTEAFKVEDCILSGVDLDTVNKFISNMKRDDGGTTEQCLNAILHTWNLKEPDRIK